MKKLPLLFLIIIFMALLLTMPDITNDGAVYAINLCLYSVIPALFPYILITNYLLSSNLYENICSFFQPLVGRLLRISKYGSFVVVLGLLCGYPMGAKLLGELSSSKCISNKEASYLITFCNNSSISFIINYIYFSCLNKEVKLSFFLLMIYLPILLTAIINRFFFAIENSSSKCFVKLPTYNPFISAVKTMGILCSYVFLFTIIAFFIRHLIPINSNYLYPLISLIEMTSGTSLIAQLNTPHILFYLCIAVLFGGLSIVFQTFALIPKYLHKYYIWGKLEQVLIFVIIYQVVMLF